MTTQLRNRKLLQGIRSVRAWISARHAAIFWVGVCLIALWVVVTTLPAISRQPIGFDEGWNLQAPLELATEGTYASFGAVFDGQTKVFDPYLSTGPAVSLPIAAVFKVFDVGIVQARIVMLGFYLATLGLIAWFLYDRKRSFLAWLGPLVLLLAMSSGMQFRIEVLGEMPSVAFALASLIAMRKQKFALAGFLAVMAMFSKFLMLLLVVAGFGYFVLRLIRHWKQKKQIFIQGLWWSIGVGAPLALWELFRFIQLGGSLHAYKENLEEFYRVFKANGSGVGETGTAGLTIARKFEMFVSNITLSPRLLWLLALCIVVGLVLGYQKLGKALRQNLYGLLFVGLYGFWWFVISNGGYTRYTLPLFLVTAVVTLGIFLYVLPEKPAWKQRASLGLKIAATVIIVCGVWTLHRDPPPRFYWDTLQEQVRIANQVKAANPSNLTHVGWWQNPEIMWLSRLHTTEYSKHPQGTHYELLLGAAQYDIVPAEYQQRAKELCQTTIFQDGKYLLCRGVKH